MIVVGDGFGEKLSGKIGADFISLENRVFPDGEVCPRVTEPEKVKGEKTVLACRMKYPANPNTYFLNYILSLRNLKKYGAEKVYTVMPYFLYSRQDRIFREGEPFSARYILDILKESGADAFFTVNSHAQRYRDSLDIADIPSHNVNGFREIAEHTKNLELENPTVIGADGSTNEWTDRVSSLLGSDSKVFEKKRDLNTGNLEFKRCRLDVKDRDVVIVDDIIASGGTMMRCVDTVRKGRPKRVICMAVHGLFTNNSLPKLRSASDRILVTDTINTPVSRISIMNGLAEKIRSLA